jgi:hypothetical protein
MAETTVAMGLETEAVAWRQRKQMQWCVAVMETEAAVVET